MATAQPDFGVDKTPDWGMTFESHFRKGHEGIIARYDAPELRFAASTPLQSVRDTVDVLNRTLQARFDGVGYYAFCPMSELDQQAGHVLVLFANQSFYEQFMAAPTNLGLPV